MVEFPPLGDVLQGRGGGGVAADDDGGESNHGEGIARGPTSSGKWERGRKSRVIHRFKTFRLESDGAYRTP